MAQQDSTPTQRRYRTVVKWSRRLTAFAAWVIVFRWIRGESPLSQLRNLFAPILPYATPISPSRASIALITCWYAFLTQLRVWWALWLPFYSVLFPLYSTSKLVLRIVGKAFLVAANPIVKAIESLDAPLDSQTPKAKTAKRRPFPTTKVWLLFFFVWAIAFRGLNVWWAAWIAPALALPVWAFFLRAAFRVSVNPKSFVTFLADACGKMLDTQVTTLSKPDVKQANASSFRYGYGIVTHILDRYSTEKMLAVIHREAMTIFALSLGAALVTSAGFWGLVGEALIRTNPQSLAAYNFFGTGTFIEAAAWAWGCMTTAVGFPGVGAATWVKCIHATILATGVFQLTFLIGCFSIMINAETSRTVAQATALLIAARSKLAQVKELEARVLGASSGSEKTTVIEGEVVKSTDSPTP